LIHQEFGDGIMSAIDFTMDIQREPDPKVSTATFPDGFFPLNRQLS